MEKLPIYDESGRVIDPEIARQAAEVEAPGHKRSIFGNVFVDQDLKLREAAINAELAIEKAYEIKNLPKMIEDAWSDYVRQEETTKEYESFEIVRIMQSDIGAGVSRYRIFGEFFNPEGKTGGLITGATHIFFLIVDTKDNQVIRVMPEEDA
jgi:hypothetical protein